MRVFREPCDVADLDEQPGGAGGAHAVQVHQGGAGGFDQRLELFVGGLLAGIDPLQVGDQLRGDPASGLAGNITGPDFGQERLSLGCGEVSLGSARDEFQQQLVQLGGHPGVVLTQRASPVDQGPQHGRSTRELSPEWCTTW